MSPTVMWYRTSSVESFAIHVDVLAPSTGGFSDKHDDVSPVLKLPPIAAIAQTNETLMRSLLRSLACSAVVIPSISLAVAQFPGPNPTSVQIEESMKAQANPANIEAWLESKDPRLIAWGAYFARENNDTAA